MNRKRLLVPLFVLFVSAGALSFAGNRESGSAADAGRVPAGDYVEIDDRDAPNPALVVRVAPVTPNILQIQGINGWVCFASYDAAKNEYRGFFEWREFGPQRGPAGKWADLYQTTVVMKAGKELRITGKSKENDFVIRAKRKG